MAIARSAASRAARESPRCNAWREPADARLAKALCDLAAEQGTRQPDGSAKLFLTQSELASMIGATRVSANRLLKTFEAAGLVHRGRSTIVITNLDALRFRAGR